MVLTVKLIQEIQNTFTKKVIELFSIDLRSLAVFRIGLASVLIFDLTNRLLYAKAFYSDNGIYPRSLALKELPYATDFLSINYLNGNEWFQYFLIFTSIVFAVFILIGYKTNLATFISWLLLISLNNRNDLFLTGADDLEVQLLFWSIFLPLGTRYSIDSTLNPVLKKSSCTVFSAATIAILIQISLLYFVTSSSKSGMEWRYEGSAIYYTLNLDSIVTPFGAYLLNFPKLLTFLTYSILYIESFGALLLFIPVFTSVIRMILILLFLFMQLGFGLSLIVGHFPWISSVAMLPFLPNSFWDKFLMQKFNLRKFKDSTNQNYKPTSLGLHPLANKFVLLCLIYVLYSGACKLNPTLMVPGRLILIGEVLKLNQRWGMFSLVPKDMGWYIIWGKLSNGIEIDLFRNEKPINWQKIQIVSGLHKKFRWNQTLERWQEPQNNLKKRLYYFSQYISNQWNTSHPKDEQLRELRIYFIKKITLPNYKSTKPEKILLYKYICLK